MQATIAHYGSPTEIVNTGPGSLWLCPTVSRESSRIRFELPRPERVTLRVFDTGGRLRGVLLDRDLFSGLHQINWYGRDASGRRAGAGHYFVCLHSLSIPFVPETGHPRRDRTGCGIGSALRWRSVRTRFVAKRIGWGNDDLRGLPLCLFREPVEDESGQIQACSGVVVCPPRSNASRRTRILAASAGTCFSGAGSEDRGSHDASGSSPLSARASRGLRPRLLPRRMPLPRPSSCQQSRDFPPQVIKQRIDDRYHDQSQQ